MRTVARGLMAGVVAVSGCGVVGNGPLQAELDAAVAKWESQDFDTYEYRFSNACECLPETSGPIIITVVSGDISEVRRPDDSNLPDRNGGPTPTIPELFDTIQSAIDEGADDIVVEYDEAFGYPTQITIDWNEQLADEETLYEASDLNLP